MKETKKKKQNDDGYILWPKHVAVTLQ